MSLTVSAAFAIWLATSGPRASPTVCLKSSNTLTRFSILPRIAWYLAMATWINSLIEGISERLSSWKKMILNLRASSTVCWRPSSSISRLPTHSSSSCSGKPDHHVCGNSDNEEDIFYICASFIIYSDGKKSNLLHQLPEPGSALPSQVVLSPSCNAQLSPKCNINLFF